MLQNSIFPIQSCVVLCADPTSCGGMSNETVRRSTFTKESVHGKIKKIPVDKQDNTLLSCINLKLPTNDIPYPGFLLTVQKNEIVSVSTWSFSLPVCNATQSEDDSTLILLNNLQYGQEDHSTSSHSNSSLQ